MAPLGSPPAPSAALFSANWRRLLRLAAHVAVLLRRRFGVHYKRRAPQSHPSFYPL